MFALTVVSLAFAGQDVSVDFADESALDPIVFGDDFDHDVARNEFATLDARLQAVIAAELPPMVHYSAVAITAPDVFADVADLLGAYGTFEAADRVVNTYGDETTSRIVSNPMVHRNADGIIQSVVVGVIDNGGSCGGSWTTYTDWLVTYDADGRPDQVFMTSNEWGDALVRHTASVGEIIYDDGMPIAIDVRSRARWLGCQLCDNGALGTSDYADTTWTHVRYDLDAEEVYGC